MAQVNILDMLGKFIGDKDGKLEFEDLLTSGTKVMNIVGQVKDLYSRSSQTEPTNFKLGVLVSKINALVNDPEVQNNVLLPLMSRLNKRNKTQ